MKTLLKSYFWKKQNYVTFILKFFWAEQLPVPCLNKFGFSIRRKKAITEKVPYLIWAPDFFSPKEIWAPRNLGPEKLGP